MHQGLYSKPLSSSRGDPIFRAHAYPTKIDPTSILACILAHTKPGDVVMDGFVGSGTTAIASLLAENPGEERLEKLDSVLSEYELGRRGCKAFDISGLACSIGSVLTNPPDVDDFRRVANDILDAASQSLAGIYETDFEGEKGVIRHVVWSEHIRCPHCDAEMLLADHRVDLTQLEMKRSAACPHCSVEFLFSDAARITEEVSDPLLGKTRTIRKLRPWLTYGKVGKKLWRRYSEPSDSMESMPDYTGLHIPIRPMMDSDVSSWGEMHRSGYHEGISHVHHFYTPRNLLVMGVLHTLVGDAPKHLRPALRLWLSSYNSSHGTLMSRVVCKSGSKDLTTTSAQSATLYVSGLPVEKNILLGLKGKLRDLCKAFAEIPANDGSVEVIHASSLCTDLEDGSIDYVFIDPPFGDNIQYSEVNFINEAWLGTGTQQSEEVIVSKHQKKDASDYSDLLRTAFTEYDRVLRPGGMITVAFHSTKAEIWSALRRAWEGAGFAVLDTSLLDKRQGSLKQVTTVNSVRGDSLILLARASEIQTDLPMSGTDAWNLVEQRISAVEGGSIAPEEMSRQRLYSFFVNTCITNGIEAPMDADGFFTRLRDEHGIGKVGELISDYHRSKDHRKRWGQYFTPRSVSLLAAALVLDGIEAGGRILDPTCGNGGMLGAIHEVAQRKGVEVRTHGVEIDPIHSAAAEGLASEVDCGDSFAILTGLNEKWNAGSYDGLVGNPPYIRVDPGEKDDSVVEFESLAEKGSKKPHSGYRKALLAHLKEGESALWRSIVSEYSERADISLPVWLLSIMNLREGARLAIVTTDSWRSRDYAIIQRMAMAEYLDIEYVVRQPGGLWFEDAEVATSMIVARKAVAGTEGPDRRVMQVSGEFNLATHEGLVGLSVHVSGSRPEDEIDAALQLARAMLDGSLQDSDSVRVSSLPDLHTREALASEASVVNRKSAKLVLRKWSSEGGRCPLPLARNKFRKFPPPKLRLEVPERRLETVQTSSPYMLLTTMIEINQGMRTGCNPAFYVGIEDEKRFLSAGEGDLVRVVLDQVIGGGTAELPRGYLRPAIRRQEDLGGPIRWALVDFGRSATRRDFDRVKKRYSRTGAWRVWRGLTPDHGLQLGSGHGVLHVMPPELEDLVTRIEGTDFGSESRPKMIRDFTAVGSNENSFGRCTTGLRVDEDPGCFPRWWYSITVMPRHTPHFFLARVQGKSGPILISPLPGECIIDANFSTISTRWDMELNVDAILSSKWVKAHLELTATPMGGGALKVEGSHLSRLVIPGSSQGMSVGVPVRLGEFTQSLSDATTSAQIDELFAEWLGVDSQKYHERMDEIITSECRMRAPNR